MKAKLRIRNESRYPDDEVEALIRFVTDRREFDVTGLVAVRVLDAREQHEFHYSGEAMRGGGPKWTSRAAHAMRLTIPPPGWVGYGIPRVCWHSTEMRQTCEWRVEHDDGRVTFGSDPAIALARVADLYDAGQSRLGRWPIYIVHDWRECLVHLAAHEALHILREDRGQGQSELVAEEWAAMILNEWRQPAAQLRAADRGPRKEQP